MTTAPLPLHLDSTMISCFRSCPQKFYLEFILGRRPLGLSIDLHAGACFASALENVYKEIYKNDEGLGDAMQIAEAKFIFDWGDFEIPEYKRTSKTRDRVWAAIESYFQLYPPHLDHVQPYRGIDGSPTFEFTFALPLDYPGFPLHPSGDHFIYCGRFDMLGSYMDRPCVRDEKTTGSSIGASWADQWNLRSQFIGYTWACRELGFDLDTVIVRGIAIQKTQIAHAEAIKVYSNELRERWFDQLRRDVIRIVAAHEAGVWDWNLADACSSYGGCVFRDACAAPDPLPWLSNFEVKHWNPLHRNPVEEKEKAA